MVQFTAPEAACPRCGDETSLARGIYRCGRHGAWSMAIEAVGAWDYAARLVPA